MNIIVTGASAGIGYEVVKEFCRNADHKIVAIARNSYNLSLLKEECSVINSKAEVIPIVFDFELDKIEDKLLPEILSNLKKVDILLNNAGTLINKPFLQISQEELTYIYKVNVFAPFILTQNVISLLGPGSHIVNISSMGGFQGSSKFPGLTSYSSTKAALVCLTECLAEEFKDSGIKFNCLALGAVQTKMLENAFPGYKAQLSAMEIAEFIASFCLTGHKYFNGKILPVSLSTP